MPYIKKVAAEVPTFGTPIMRPMFMEFPSDRTSWYLDQQYMFGPDLLVAPVFSESGEVEFYLPKGIWSNYFTGEKVVGGIWMKEVHDFMSLPLYVREEKTYLDG